jgi:hypothetical protein
MASPRKKSRKAAARHLHAIVGKPAVRTAIVVAGVAGLAALAAAVLSQRRVREDFVRRLESVRWEPLAAAVAPQADRVWAETRPWRDQVTRMLSSINTEEVRELVAQRLSHWMERFR